MAPEKRRGSKIAETSALLAALADNAESSPVAPSLVLAPPTEMASWEQALAQHAPDLNAVLLHGCADSVAIAKRLEFFHDDEGGDSKGGTVAHRVSAISGRERGELGERRVPRPRAFRPQQTSQRASRGRPSALAHRSPQVKFDVLVSTPEASPHWTRLLGGLEWVAIVIDEGGCAGSPDEALQRVALGVRARWRVLLPVGRGMTGAGAGDCGVRGFTGEEAREEMRGVGGGGEGDGERGREGTSGGASVGGEGESEMEELAASEALPQSTARRKAEVRDGDGERMIGQMGDEEKPVVLRGGETQEGSGRGTGGAKRGREWGEEEGRGQEMEVRGAKRRREGVDDEAGEGRRESEAGNGRERREERGRLDDGGIGTSPSGGGAEERGMSSHELMNGYGREARVELMR